MITYYKLWDVLNRNNMTKQDLKKAIKCGSNTITSMSKNEYVSLKTIDKICELFNCQPNDIIEYKNKKRVKKTKKLISSL